MLTTSFLFFVAETDEDLFWKSNVIRENLRSRFFACARTAIQRILEIARYKVTKEVTCGKLPNTKIVEAYRKHLVVAAGSEEISEKYVEIALRIA